MRRSAIKTVDRFGESREGLCKSEAEKGSDISGPVRAVEIQLGDMGESHMKNHAGESISVWMAIAKCPVSLGCSRMNRLMSVS